MKPKKIVIINDDIDDTLAIKARLPASIDVIAQSQYDAQSSGIPAADLVILDNDANNLKDSKGAKTLEALNREGTKTPILYTSFQPGWVPQSVYATKGVRVVKTDELCDVIAKEFGLKLRKPKKADQPEPQTNILLTYNTVHGYDAGVHGNGKVLIVCYDKHAGIRAKEVLARQLAGIYKTFDWRADRDKIRNIFVYDGVNGGELPGYAASALGHDVRMNVHMLACSCDWERKKRFANSMYTILHQVECGGRSSMGAVADVLLGVQRARPYRLPMPKEMILAKSERFDMY